MNRSTNEARNLTRRALIATAAGAVAALGLPASALADPTVDDLQAQLDAARAELDSMGAALSELQGTLSTQTEELETTRSAIWETESQIQDTQTQLDETRAALSERMVSSYKEGSGSALDLVLGSTSIEDLTSRIFYLDKLAESDSETIDRVNELARQLTEQRDALTDQQAEQESQVETTKQSMADYEDKVAEAQSYYASLDAQVQQAIQEEAAKQESESVSNAVNVINGGSPSASAGESGDTGAGTGNSGSNESGSGNAGTSGGSGTESGGSSDGGSSSGSADSGTSQGPGASHPEIVSVAATMIGKPYMHWWEGVNYGPGAAGYDCCGLCATAYQLCGYNLPYQAPVAQIMSLIKSRGNWRDCNLSNYQSVLAPGDVIVCSTGHVAIYAGGNQMIHAPNPGRTVCYATVYACIGGGFAG